MISNLLLLLLATLVSGNYNQRIDVEEKDNSRDIDNKGLDSFGSPVYSDPRSVDGKPAYYAPLSPVAPYSPSYAAYIPSTYPYGVYNPYNSLPYPLPSSLNYASLLQNGLGYNLPPSAGYYNYGNPNVGNLAYPPYGPSLAYLYGGLGYSSGPAAVARVSAPPIAIAPRYALPPSSIPVPAAPSTVLPTKVAYFSAPAAPAAPAVLSPTITYSSNAPVPQAVPYRSMVRVVQGKDGSVRYTYTQPDGSQSSQAY